MAGNVNGMAGFAHWVECKTWNFALYKIYNHHEKYRNNYRY